MGASKAKQQDLPVALNAKKPKQAKLSSKTRNMKFMSKKTFSVAEVQEEARKEEWKGDIRLDLPSSETKTNDRAIIVNFIASRGSFGGTNQYLEYRVRELKTYVVKKR
ncbi:hypothetical protein PCE1_004943 [Barthelona sp. PCE]